MRCADAFLKCKVVLSSDAEPYHAHHVARAPPVRRPDESAIAVFGHVAGYPEVYSVAPTNGNPPMKNAEQMNWTPWSGWHTDITAAVNPPCASILRGRDDPALWRRYVSGPISCRLSGAVGRRRCSLCSTGCARSTLMSRVAKPSPASNTTGASAGIWPRSPA